MSSPNSYYMSKSQIKSVKALPSVEALKLGYTLGWREAEHVAKPATVSASSSNSNTQMVRQSHKAKDMDLVATNVVVSATRYIVEFVSAINESIIEKAGGSIITRMPLLGMVIANFPSLQAANTLKQNSVIASVSPDLQVAYSSMDTSDGKTAPANASISTNTTAGASSNTPSAANAPWCWEGSQECWQNVAIGANELHKLGITGKGVGLLAIDSELDIRGFSMRNCNLKGYRSFSIPGQLPVGYVPSPYDDINWHGTSVTSLIVAQPIKAPYINANPYTWPVIGPNSPFPANIGVDWTDYWNEQQDPRGKAPNGTVGAAYDVNFYFAATHTSRGATPSLWSNALQAYEWALTLLKKNGGAEERLIITQSVGFFEDSPNPAHAQYIPLIKTTWKNAIDKLYEAGVLIFCAAGNRSTLNQDGVSVIYPAAFENVISVGGIDITGQLVQNSGNPPQGGSTRNPDVELCAPSAGVICCSPLQDFGNGILAEAYTFGGGTSCASPLAAAAAALVWEACPGLSNKQLRKQLTDSAKDLGPTGRNIGYGFGLVNPMGAIKNFKGLYKSFPN